MEGQFDCIRPDTFCYETKNELNMGNNVIWNQFL